MAVQKQGHNRKYGWLESKCENKYKQKKQKIKNNEKIAYFKKDVVK